jgi:hypothetical protein
VTLGYPGKVVISSGSCGTWCSMLGLSDPTEAPQLRDMVAVPHRNPTDETAYSGTLVMRVKGTENSRSAALMRVSGAVGAFSRWVLSG